MSTGDFINEEFLYFTMLWALGIPVTLPISQVILMYKPGIGPKIFLLLSKVKTDFPNLIITLQIQSDESHYVTELWCMDQECCTTLIT